MEKAGEGRSSSWREHSEPKKLLTCLRTCVLWQDHGDHRSQQALYTLPRSWSFILSVVGETMVHLKQVNDIIRSVLLCFFES